MDSAARDATAALVAEVNAEFSQALEQIEHCVRQLDDEQIWWRPRPEMNSIGNLLCHLAGNLRQWVISGLGGAPDSRDRPGEFSVKVLPRAEVWPPLQQTVAEVQAVLSRLQVEDLMQQHRIQGFDVSGWHTVIHTVTHFRGHTQEITSLTRQMLGERYQFKFVPATRAQGAPAARE